MCTRSILSIENLRSKDLTRVYKWMFARRVNKFTCRREYNFAGKREASGGNGNQCPRFLGREILASENNTGKIEREGDE